MKYEYQIRMQQRHLKAIVGALKFRQRLLSGDVYGTIGCAAMDAWVALPDFAKELRARIGHLEAVVAHLDVGEGGVGYVARQCDRMKSVAWQIVGGNYGPWFTHKTRFLYDIYSVIQHEEGAWRYSTVYPLVSNVPLMEISRCV